MVIMGMRWEPNRRITEREWKVWELVAGAMGNDEICEMLDYSDKTIQTTISALYTKLSIPDGSARRVKLAMMFPLKRQGG